MDEKYLLGVALAVLSGTFFQFGLVLQKKVVNEVPREAREKRFMRTLLKRPLWITGFLLEFGVGTTAFLLAQGLIGPALVPGLMASGLIILAIGSAQINGETLNRAEVVGIGLMILGILSLGLSQLGISIEVVREALTRPDTVRRIAFFSSTLLLLWTATHMLSLRDRNRKGILMAFSNGFPFSLSNFWVSPLLAVIFLVLGGKGSFGQVVIFVLASVILVGANVLGIRQTQEAFKFAQASNAIPVQQVSIQISPILVYFYVFSLTPPTRISAACMIGGVLLILTSGFLLGRRQSEIEAIE